MAPLGAALSAIVLLALAVAAAGEGDGLQHVAEVKAQRSNPVMAAVVDGVALNLVLTTDIDGVAVCLDLDPNGDSDVANATVGFDTTRRRLRLELQALNQHPTLRAVTITALNATRNTRVAYFGLSEQPFGSPAIESVLLAANASGFLGVGLARDPAKSLLWAMLDDSGHQYSYAGLDADNQTARLFSDNSSGKDTKVWSEPASAIDANYADGPNRQSIVFQVHNLHYQCLDTSETEAIDSEESEDETSSTSVRTVLVFGAISSSWDVQVDFNAPCLVLPLEFFNALGGWIGLEYNEQLGISEIPATTTLPVLFLSLTHGGRRVALPLEDLVLPALQLNASDGAAETTRLCIQRSLSVVQNGATVFAALDSDAGSVQRYRIQGSLALPLYNMIQAPVVLGTMVLDALHGLTVNGTNKSVGIAAPHIDSTVAITCKTPVVCVGQQHRDDSTNACIDPDCDKYYFHSLDETSKLCVVQPGWLITLAATTVAFAGAELLFTYSSRRLVRESQPTAATRPA